nr:tRNA lysidine(34) synthetase TilS [Pseudomonadota bacterium]
IAHWPQAAASIAHSAALCRDAAEQIDVLVEESLRRLRRDERQLDAAGWSALPDTLRMGVLECWLHALGIPAPTQAQCAELKRQVDGAHADRVPCVTWPGAEMHVWRGALYAMPPLPPLPVEWESAWDGTPLSLPAGGTLTLHASDVDAAPPNLDPPLTVRLRRSGERIKPAGDKHTRELRDLFQHAGVPPWQRGRYPMIYQDDVLLAVADRWSSDAGAAYFERVGVRPKWNA